MEKQPVGTSGGGYNLPPHHSASSLMMFRACPWKYKERYLLGADDKPSTAALMGVAFHDVVDMLEKGRIPPSRFAMMAASRFAVLVDETVARVGADGIETYSRDLADDVALRRQQLVEQCARYQHHRQTRTDQLAASEAGFTLHLSGVARPIVGRIDQILVDATGCTRVLDLKTGSTRFSSSLQLLVYNLGAQSLGYTPATWGYYWYGKDGKMVTADISGGTPEYVGGLFRRLEAAIQQDLIQPNPGGNCYLCPHKKGCPEAWHPYS